MKVYQEINFAQNTKHNHFLILPPLFVVYHIFPQTQFKVMQLKQINYNHIIKTIIL